MHITPMIYAKKYFYLYKLYFHVYLNMLSDVIEKKPAPGDHKPHLKRVCFCPQGQWSVYCTRSKYFDWSIKFYGWYIWMFCGTILKYYAYIDSNKENKQKGERAKKL